MEEDIVVRIKCIEHYKIRNSHGLAILDLKFDYRHMPQSATVRKYVPLVN